MKDNDRGAEENGIAESLLVRDRQSELNQPEILRGLPVYKWEDFTAGITQNEKSIQGISEQSGEPVFLVLGSGQDGLTFRMKLGNKDWAIKLFFSTGGVGDQNKDALLRLMSGKKTELEEGLLVENSADERQKQSSEHEVRGQTAAWALGHICEKDWIEAPIGMFSVEGRTVGLIMPFIEGEPRSPMSLAKGEVEGIYEVVDKLERVGVGWDQMYDRPNMIKKSDGSWRLIDLGLRDHEVLERDPRKLREGEYYRELDPESGTKGPFDRASSFYSQAYSEIGKLKIELAALKDSHLKGQSGETQGSFDALANGKVIISDKNEHDEVERLSIIFGVVENWISNVGTEGIENMRACLPEEGDRLSIVWRKNDIDHQINLEMEEGKIEFHIFRYVRQDYTHENSRTMVMEKKDGKCECRLTTFDRSLRKSIDWYVGQTEGWEQKATEWGWNNDTEAMLETNFGNEEEVRKLVHKLIS